MYQHVDDLSALVVADTKRALVQAALEFATEFKEHTDRLQLEITDKSTIVPDTVQAKQVATAATTKGIRLKTEREGVDIGVDSVAGTRRCVKKQNSRISATAKRAKRTAIVARRRHKARRVVLTGVRPAVSYVHTAIGMAPTNVRRCRSRITEATGLTSAGSCASTILRWCFRRGTHSRRTADPRVVMPLEQVKTWVKLWESCSAADRSRIKKA